MLLIILNIYDYDTICAPVPYNKQRHAQHLERYNLTYSEPLLDFPGICYCLPLNRRRQDNQELSLCSFDIAR